MWDCVAVLVTAQSNLYANHINSLAGTYPQSMASLACSYCRGSSGHGRDGSCKSCGAPA